MNELLGETEVHDIDEMCILADAHQEIVRLDVAVQNVLLVHELDAFQDLLAQLQDCSQAHALAIISEEVFQTRAQKIH